MGRLLRIGLLLAACGPARAPRAPDPDPTLPPAPAPDAGFDPCAVDFDALPSGLTVPSDGWSFDNEPIENCLDHPEGIID